MPTVDSNSGKSIENLLNGIGSAIPKAKFASAKTPLEISKHNPAALYEYLSDFRKMLNSENKILKWTAIDVIANISVADPKNLLQSCFRSFCFCSPTTRA